MKRYEYVNIHIGKFCGAKSEEHRNIIDAYAAKGYRYVGYIPTDINVSQQVLQKLAYLMATRLMRPKVMVEYDRVPYVYRAKDANVRVTFDSNIISGSDVRTFLDEKIFGRGVMPAGKALMEVKFDSFLPDEIYSVLQLDGLKASTFSKYYLCRRYNL